MKYRTRIAGICLMLGMAASAAWAQTTQESKTDKSSSDEKPSDDRGNLSQGALTAYTLPDTTAWSTRLRRCL